MTADGVVLDRGGLDRLIAALGQRGYKVLGPTRVDGAIVYGEVSGTADLPVGVKDEQAPGSYRLNARDDGALFGYVVGPHSLKTYLHPPEAILWSGDRTDGTLVVAPRPAPPRYAFIGVRPCELAAAEVQDRVFLGARRDTVYEPLRLNAFMVAVNCVEPGGTCFCASMGTGPRAASGFDIAITEVIDGRAHYFFCRSGSDQGAEVLAIAEARPASKAESASADRLVGAAAGRMGRSMPASGVRQSLQSALDHPRWQQTAKRCLTCGNCTLVCPTCFCATVEDTLSLSGEHAERVRRWDSCFTHEFSYIHGGPLRLSASARYRQWITHKLSWWHDQFGVSGCVGCGRCITWCPVGIDITEEVAAIRSGREVADV
jgi:sulfhydrogenase subunit beta (sulfur reductase)